MKSCSVISQGTEEGLYHDVIEENKIYNIFQ